MKIDNLSLDQIFSSETEIIPVVTEVIEDDTQDKQADYPSVLPLLPLRNMMLFPGVIMPVSIGRESSKKLIEENL